MPIISALDGNSRKVPYAKRKASISMYIIHIYIYICIIYICVCVHDTTRKLILGMQCVCTPRKCAVATIKQHLSHAWLQELGNGILLLTEGFSTSGPQHPLRPTPSHAQSCCCHREALKPWPKQLIKSKKMQEQHLYFEVVL